MKYKLKTVINFHPLTDCCYVYLFINNDIIDKSTANMSYDTSRGYYYKIII